MNPTSVWTRRGFIKAAGIVGGATLMFGATGGPSAHAAPPAGSAVRDEILKGVSDIHVHAAPDESPEPLMSCPSPARLRKRDTVR